MWRGLPEVLVPGIREVIKGIAKMAQLANHKTTRNVFLKIENLVIAAKSDSITVAVARAQ